MFILFAIVLIDLIGFGIVIPLLPFYGTRFSASPFEVTLLMATYANGRQTRDEEADAVTHMKSWYHGRLGVPMTRMIIDLDTSQTPSNA